MDKEFEKLQKENETIRKEIDNIAKDFNMEESKNDLWGFINLLIDNEIEQEKFCGE